MTTAQQKVELSQEEYDNVLADLTKKFSTLVREWKHDRAGKVSTWMSLFSDICRHVQKHSNIRGVQKAELAVDAVTTLCRSFLNENIASIPEEAKATLQLILSDSGVNLLKGATGMIKGLLKGLDKNQDGEISMDEFVQGCFGCCVNKKKRKAEK